MAITTKHILIFAISMMLGGLTGTFVKIEEKIEYFGEFLLENADREIILPCEKCIITSLFDGYFNCVYEMNK